MNEKLNLVSARFNHLKLYFTSEAEASSSLKDGEFQFIFEFNKSPTLN